MPSLHYQTVPVHFQRYATPKNETKERENVLGGAVDTEGETLEVHNFHRDSVIRKTLEAPLKRMPFVIINVIAVHFLSSRSLE